MTYTCYFYYLLNFLLELFIMKYVKIGNICSYCFINVCTVYLTFTVSENAVFWTSSELC